MFKLQSQSSRALSAALSVSAKCLQKKNTIVILDGVLLTQKGDKLMFTSATTDSRLTIEAPLNIVNGEFSKPVALPLNGIMSFLSTLPDCVVNMTFNDDLSLIVEYCIGSGDKVKTGKASLTYMDGSEFPLVPDLKKEDSTHICLPANLLLSNIEQARVFCAKDEIRLVMNTLCIDIAEDTSECYMVATDGHMIFKYTHTNSDESKFFRGGKPGTILICNAYFKALSAFAQCEEINVESDGSSIKFTSGEIEFICKNVEGRYPNYNAVIPKGNPHFITFDKKEIIDSIKRVSIFGNAETQLVQFTKESMFINVSARDLTHATTSTEEVFITDSQCPDGFSIGFNATYFINALNAIDADTVRMQLSDPARPVIFTADVPSPHTLSLCMPMRLES